MPLIDRPASVSWMFVYKMALSSELPLANQNPPPPRPANQSKGNLAGVRGRKENGGTGHWLTFASWFASLANFSCIFTTSRAQGELLWGDGGASPVASTWFPTVSLCEVRVAPCCKHCKKIEVWCDGNGRQAQATPSSTFPSWPLPLLKKMPRLPASSPPCILSLYQPQPPFIFTYTYLTNNSQYTLNYT